MIILQIKSMRRNLCTHLIRILFLSSMSSTLGLVFCFFQPIPGVEHRQSWYTVDQDKAQSVLPPSHHNLSKKLELYPYRTSHLHQDSLRIHTGNTCTSLWRPLLKEYIKPLSFTLNIHHLCFKSRKWKLHKTLKITDHTVIYQ